VCVCVYIYIKYTLNFVVVLGALQDFDKVSLSNVEKSNDINTDSQKQTDKHEMSEERWTKDFLKQTADQFEKNLQNLLQNGEIIKNI